MWAERLQRGAKVGSIPTFSFACEQWINSHCNLYNAPGTIKKNYTLLKELLPIFGNRNLNQITTQDIEHHLGKLSLKGLSKSSLKHRVALMKSVYQWHIKRGVPVINPCLALPPIKGEEQTLNCWTQHQATAFLEFTKSKYATDKQWVHLLYMLALNTGMRWGEIVGLPWSAVDLQGGLITVKQILDEKLGQIRSFTKSRKIRYIGINDTLSQLLVNYYSSTKEVLIFTNLVANPLNRGNFYRRQFIKDVDASGCPRIRFHDLRHTYATLYMANGGNIYDLQKILGHSTLAMTDRYSHFSPTHATRRSNVVNLGS